MSILDPVTAGNVRATTVPPEDRTALVLAVCAIVKCKKEKASSLKWMKAAGEVALIVTI